MARFGQGLIQGLMNPSFGPQLGRAGMLAGSLPGRMREAQAEQAKIEAQRRAQESIYQMLNTGNPLDPNVVAAATQAGSAAQLDPKAVQTAIRQAQTGARENERLGMARQDFRVRQAEAKVRQQEAQEAADQQKVAQYLEGAFASGVDPEKAMLNVPTAHRGYAREYASEYQSFLEDARKRQEEAAKGTPLTGDELEMYQDVVGEEAIEAYKKQQRVTPAVARTRLEKLFNSAMQERIKQDARQKTRELEPPTQNEVELMQATVERELGGSVDFRLPWGPEGIRSPVTTEGGQYEDQLADIAYAAAAKRRTDPNWAPTKDNLESLAKELFGGSDEEELGEIDDWYSGLDESTKIMVDQARRNGYTDEEIRAAL